MIHLKIPQDTLFASFKFTADETQMSLFGCSARNISLYMKYGSPPVINPDNSTFPKNVKNITRSKLHNLEFLSDKTEHYINITSPDPGSYYATTFLSYTDPRYNAITQQGLSPSCYASVEAVLLVKKADTPIIISEDDLIEVISSINEKNVENLVVRIDINKPPSSEVFQSQETLHPNNSNSVLFFTKPDSWHYIEMIFQNQSIENTIESLSNLTFRIRFYMDTLLESHSSYKELANKTFYNNSISKVFYDNRIIDTIPYKRYDLIREASTESFLFSYELEAELDSTVAIPVNMTNKHFSVFKFNIREGSDLGGTLQYIMAFKPRVKREDSIVTVEKEPAGHTVIACIRRGAIEIPTWPNKCVLNGVENQSQLVLNSTVTNSTILVPFPESGTWYASFKLFCHTCDLCNCTESCQEQYEACTESCELNCITGFNCSSCATDCKQLIVEAEDCSGCNCDGGCLINENNTCNSSILFDVGSQPCVLGRCSDNGKCMFMVSDGVVFSTCVCSNKYRGPVTRKPLAAMCSNFDIRGFKAC
ncbi:hypothetical protein NQ317_012036 [Molorchus minor]|uniref:Uncharacterized protein n=1 Tax=Molorchus minor TaxID=1323400 RepID=A0ABQ9J039_9CUCU|nr:hypothetical protein NQ317_012036 [Molorchus minor]